MPDFFKSIGAARIGAMAGVAAVLTAFFLYIAGVIAEPPKTILFSGLEARDASAVVAKLQTMNVAFEQRGDGGTILVPSDQALSLRMQLATDGLPSAGVGYEIFDKSDTFGATAFVQNVNRLRALEGELVRSIRSIDSIADARVHLVVPDRQVFARDNQPPSASVMLKTRTQLGRGQVAAIQHLVAAAVAGLSANNVAIVDDKGQLLANGSNDGSDAAIASAQEDRISNFEDRLRERVEGIVASVVGPGKVRVQVSADMDFKKITQSSETFDPDGRVVRSSQTVEQTGQEKNGSTGAAVSVGNALPGQAAPAAGADNTTSANTRTEETVNYEISKKTTTETQDAGNIKRLSVAVVVDGVTTTNEQGAANYAPRSEEDMTKITDLVKSAIGFNEARGDTLRVTNMQFATIDFGPQEPVAEPLLGLDSQIWFKLGEILILSIAAVVVGLFVVRPMIYRLTSPPTTAHLAVARENVTAIAGSSGGEAGAAPQAQIAQGGGPQLALPRRESIDVSQIEGQVRESAVKKIGEVVSAHPDEAMAILRTWIHQPA